MSPFSLSSENLDKLVLACLFHDVGYPLSRLGQSFRSTAQAMRNCYNIASEASQTSELKLKLKKNLLISILSVDEKKIEDQLKKLDHGLLGALEFITYLKNRCINHYTDVIRAIAFHSPSFNFEVDDKLLTVLILADELQDWGRPVNLTVLPKIHNFELCNNSLEGECNTECISNYSVLKQIHSKSQNLNRIRLPKNFSFKLRFPVNNLRMIELRNFEMNLQLLFNYCVSLEKSLFSPSLFTKLYESNSPFENIYYGLSIPKEIKMKILDLLDKETISSNSPFKSYHAFMNRALGELLFTPGEVDEIRSFTFKSSTDRLIRLEMDCSRGSFKGRIRSVRDSEVFELVLLLMAELRFYNICIQKITRFPSVPYPVDIGIEGFPEDSDLGKLLSKVRRIKDYESFEYLRPIRDCVFNDGFFLFEKM